MGVRSCREVLTAGQKKFQDKQSLNFMYMAPPGLAQALEREKKEKASQDAEALKPDAPGESLFTTTLWRVPW